MGKKNSHPLWVTLACLTVLCCLAATGAAQRVPIEPPDVTLDELAGSPTPVTVVLAGSGAEDPNLRLVEATGDGLVLIDEQGHRIAYVYADIARVVVQGEVVARERLSLDTQRQLGPEEQQIVERAYTRARELFASTAEDQNVRLQAASLLANRGDTEALSYLLRLTRSGNPTAELLAALQLYMAGYGADLAADSTRARALERAREEVAPGETIALPALYRRVTVSAIESGSQTLRPLGALLAGVTGVEEAIPPLNRMFRDRAADLVTPAAIALSFLDVDEIVPRLVNLLEDNSEEKSGAAVFALVQLAPPGIGDTLRGRLDDADPTGRLRMALVLYELEEEGGRETLLDIIRSVPTLATEAALPLAADGNFEAMNHLRDRLDRRVDPELPAINRRIRVASALVRGGDPSAMSSIQQYLRDSNPGVVQIASLGAIAVGEPNLLPVLQATIESATPQNSLSGCLTAIAIADPELRERMLQYSSVLL